MASWNLRQLIDTLSVVVARDYCCSDEWSVCVVLNHSESQLRADSPDVGRPKTLPLDQSSSTQSRAGPIIPSTIPAHMKSRRSMIAADSVRSKWLLDG